MNTWWNKRRFTLLNAALCAEVKKLAESCGEMPRTYLGELVEMACYEQGQKTADCPTIVDELVAAWLDTHRSGRPCTLVPISSPSDDEYFLPRGITVLTDWATA